MARSNPVFHVLFLVCVSGCATAQSAMKHHTSFSKYHKVYLLNAEQDPRHVLPKVSERLEHLGFQVMLTKEDEPIGGRQGTGFLISSDGYILTSAHVLGKQHEATVWVDGTRYEAELIYKEEDSAEDDEQNTKRKKSHNITEAMDASLNSQDNRSIVEEFNEKDLALLKITSPHQAFVPTSFAIDPSYLMGQDIYTMGFPLSHILGNTPRLNKGLISSAVGMRDHPDFVQMSAEIQPGNSGGPLLNERGQVVGMVQMTLNPMTVLSRTGDSLPQNVNFAVKSKVLHEFLKRGADKAKVTVQEGEAVPFDIIQHSIVKIHSGIIPEGFTEEPKLVCVVSYSYLWDLWYRFQALDIMLYDLDTEEILLRAGQYGDHPLSTENTTLDNVFKEIRSKMGR